MEIRDKKILVLGGWGLVGSAICHKLMEHNPSAIIISSLREYEAKEAVEALRKEYKDKNPDMFIPKWGNIFTRTELKDLNWGDVLANKDWRKLVISDIYDELDDNILKSSAIYDLISDTKPDIVIDCINTATAIAYQDVYSTTRAVRVGLAKNEINEDTVERLLASIYMPQLIRHVQLVYRSLLDNSVKMYMKIGTSGTGGMGLNIPYTHSEESPSRVLLAKSGVAGAQTLLLFLMARTPYAPLVKEIKPTAAIAWKKIAYDKVYRKGQPIRLVDMNIQDAKPITEPFRKDDLTGVQDLNKDYESVFIDTGENGIFSKGEFQAISSLGQMEVVTPEDIAVYTIFEILGGNTGHDVIQGLDSFSLGPTYRGGMLHNQAIKKLNELEKKYNIHSIAFEALGPPRLSKLLYEAHIINLIVGKIKNIFNYTPEQLSNEAFNEVSKNNVLRSEMLSIGLGILLPDGKKYLRGKNLIIPNIGSDEIIELNDELINYWCKKGWIDLRHSNMRVWIDRFKNIIAQAESISADETSSRFTYNIDYWDNFEDIDEGKVVGWIFEFEDKGWRFKR